MVPDTRYRVYNRVLLSIPSLKTVHPPPLVVRFNVAIATDVATMVKDLKKKGISIKDEPGVSVVRLFGPGVGDEKVHACPRYPDRASEP